MKVCIFFLSGGQSLLLSPPISRERQRPGWQLNLSDLLPRSGGQKDQGVPSASLHRGFAKGWGWGQRKRMGPLSFNGDLADCKESQSSGG